MPMPDNKKPSSPEEAIWEIYARQVSIEQTLRGVQGTEERGLVGEVQEVKALSVEVKNYYIGQQARLSAIEAKCAERTAAGNDCVPATPSSKREVAKAGGYGGVGIIIGFTLDWLLTLLRRCQLTKALHFRNSAPAGTPAGASF